MKRLCILLIVGLALARCGQPDMPSAPAISESPLNKVALQYRLLDFLTDGRGMAAVDLCSYEYEPTFFVVPIEERSRVDVPEFARDNPEELALIQERTGIHGEPATLSGRDIVALYEEILNLETIDLSIYDDGKYRFEIGIKNTENITIRVQGIISDRGAIHVTDQQRQIRTCSIASPATP